MTTGKRIAQARRRAKLTQAELAQQAGVTRSWIGSVETDRPAKPQPDNLRKIAPILGLDVRELLGLSDQLGASVLPLVPQDQSATITALLDINRDLVAAVSAPVGRIDRLTNEQAGGLRDLAEAIGDLARQASRASGQAGSTGGGSEQVRHRTQRKRPAGGARPSWDEEPEAQSRAS